MEIISPVYYLNVTALLLTFILFAVGIALALLGKYYQSSVALLSSLLFSIVFYSSLKFNTYYIDYANNTISTVTLTLEVPEVLSSLLQLVFYVSLLLGVFLLLLHLYNKYLSKSL